MSKGYDQFFKSAKKAKSENGRKEGVVRSALKMKAQPPRSPSGKRSLPVLPLVALLMAIAGVAYGYINLAQVESFLSRVEVELIGQTMAAEGEAAKSEAKKANGEKSAQPGEGEAAKHAGAEGKGEKNGCVEMKGFSQEELSHFNKLNERKNELDLRDAELTALEEELHKQRIEVEERVGKLERIRDEVAGVLKDRVEIDQQTVATLVDFYSNMKPKQAADVFANINEDLAIEVLGKMKKKSAADILNLLESGKARALSEKFTGYKRR